MTFHACEINAIWRIIPQQQIQLLQGWGGCFVSPTCQQNTIKRGLCKGGTQSWVLCRYFFSTSTLKNVKSRKQIREVCKKHNQMYLLFGQILSSTYSGPRCLLRRGFVQFNGRSFAPASVMLLELDVPSPFLHPAETRASTTTSPSPSFTSTPSPPKRMPGSCPGCSGVPDTRQCFP